MSQKKNKDIIIRIKEKLKDIQYFKQDQLIEDKTYLALIKDVMNVINPEGALLAPSRSISMTIPNIARSEILNGQFKCCILECRNTKVTTLKGLDYNNKTYKVYLIPWDVLDVIEPEPLKFKHIIVNGKIISHYKVDYIRCYVMPYRLPFNLYHMIVYKAAYVIALSKNLPNAEQHYKLYLEYRSKANKLDFQLYQMRNDPNC